MKKIFFILCLFFSIIQTSFAAGIPVEEVFSDITSDYKYRDELQELYDREMIIPDASGKFSPEAFLNRDEFVGISMEVICEKCIAPHTDFKFIEEYANKDIYFDIDATNPYFYCVAEADKKNYVRGYDISQSCENGTQRFGERPFCPSNRINLEEAVAVLLRNSGIFTIEDNQKVTQDINLKKITQKLGNDVEPTDSDGNPYTFYGYLQKALSFTITEYDTYGNEKKLRLLEPDADGNINPKKSITKEEFLRMSYIALKSNSCSDINDYELALKMLIWEKSCTPGDVNCTLSGLDDPDNTYDFEPEVAGTCEAGIIDPTGYIWRFVHIDTGEEKILYGKYINDYTFAKTGEWRVFLRVVDVCGQSSEVYSTIYVGPDTSVDQYIDVDIDVYDDNCTGSNVGCNEIEFENEEDDGDDIYDFDGDVSTSCKIGSITYKWTFSQQGGGLKYTFNTEFVDNFEFLEAGVWNILLEVRDGCGQTGSEQMTYIVVDDTPVDQYIDVDIDVYDDNCTGSNAGCVEIEFENEEDDGDDIYDFDGDVSTSCKIGSITYKWTFSQQGGGLKYTFNTEFVDNFEFLEAGVWNILLEVKDGCGQTGSEQMTYIVKKGPETSLSVGIIANPIYGYEDLLVNFEAIVSGGVGPYTYIWTYGDTSSIDFGSIVDHLYLDDGVYEVLLTVIDSEGNSGTATVIIKVLDQDACLQDSDEDGVMDCEDACPLVAGSIENGGCPIFEKYCSTDSECSLGYTCQDTDLTQEGNYVCLPSFDPTSSCLYQADVGSIFGNTLCSTCPCPSSVDFLADIRKCDFIFPAITSPDGSEIFSKGKIWQVQ